MLAKGLREEAYAVDVVGDGESAVYQATITDYDAVILDVVLAMNHSRSSGTATDETGFDIAVVPRRCYGRSELTPDVAWVSAK